MRATKIWHCECCHEQINPGDEFYIKEGSLYKKDHPILKKEIFSYSNKPRKIMLNLVKKQNNSFKNQ